MRMLHTCWNKGRANLQTPCNSAYLVNGEVGAESEEDAKGGPHLPAHDEGTWVRVSLDLGHPDQSFSSHL